MNIKSRRPQKKPFLSKRHRRDRMRFARINNDTPWNDVIFSDEKRFRLRPDGPARVWRHPNVSLPVQETEKFGGGSIMVWAGMRSDGYLVVQRCSDHMDGREYQKIIESAFDTGLFQRPDGRRIPLFQHDNAGPHRSRFVQAFFDINDVQVLNWPAQSPDLNIIEHVWPMISRRLGNERYTNKDALWASIKDVVEQLSFSNDLRRLYGTMGRRLQAVQKSRGGHTRY